MRTHALGLAVLLLAGCGPNDTDPGPGGVTVGEARALDEAAETLDEQRLPKEALPEEGEPEEAAPEDENPSDPPPLGEVAARRADGGV